MKLSYQQLVGAYTDQIQEILCSHHGLAPYFITTSFSDFSTDASNQIKSKIKFVWKQYDAVYRHLTSRLMRHFTDKRHLHPRTYDFIDLPGTRHSFKINVYEPKTPHLHSVVLIHPDTLGRFQLLATEQFQSIVVHPSLQFLVSIHAEEIDLPTLPTVVRYAAKFLENDNAQHLLDDDTDLFNQFPRGRFESSRGQNRGQFPPPPSLADEQIALRKEREELHRRLASEDPLPRSPDRILPDLNVHAPMTGTAHDNFRLTS